MYKCSATRSSSYSICILVFWGKGFSANGIMKFCRSHGLNSGNILNNDLGQVKFKDRLIVGQSIILDKSVVLSVLLRTVQRLKCRRTKECGRGGPQSLVASFTRNRSKPREVIASN